jgi:hypothetical protein
MNEKKIQFVGTDQTNNRIGITQPNQNELVTILGTLTSRIETKKDYYYGFFKLANQELDTPVIFKDDGGNYKPILSSGSQVQLTGT